MLIKKPKQYINQTAIKWLDSLLCGLNCYNYHVPPLNIHLYHSSDIVYVEYVPESYPVRGSRKTAYVSTSIFKELEEKYEISEDATYDLISERLEKILKIEVLTLKRAHDVGYPKKLSRLKTNETF